MSHCSIFSALLYEKHQPSDCRLVFYLNRRESGIPMVYALLKLSCKIYIGDCSDPVHRAAPIGTMCSAIFICSELCKSFGFWFPLTIATKKCVYFLHVDERLTSFTAMLDEHDSIPQYLKKKKKKTLKYTWKIVVQWRFFQDPTVFTVGLWHWGLLKDTK